jgi:hypothetical protein
MENFDNNHFLYGVVHEDLWLIQNYIVNFFINNFSMKPDDFFLLIENPGFNYQTSLTKTIIASWDNKQVIFLSANFYNMYYSVIKNFKGYIFILDLSVYQLNFIENIKILNIITEEKNFNEYINYSCHEYLNLNNYQYHQEIIQESFKKNLIDWEYLRKNWDFLYWYIPFWLSNQLINYQYVSWNYISSLILLIEYYPCLYSFFPEKKQLTCDYIYNMIKYCKKI